MGYTTSFWMLSWPHGENDIFGFFKVWHANRGWTKYGINSYPFFIWHLECNERYRIKNVISNFVAPKLRVETTHGSRLDFTWLNRSTTAASKIFLGLAFELWEWKMFFFFGKFDRVNRSTLTWSTLTSDPSGCAGLTQWPKKMHRAAKPSKGLSYPPFGSF